MTPAILHSTPNLSTAYSLLISSAHILDNETSSKHVPIKVSSTDNMNNHSPIACLESYINSTVPIGTSLSTDATAPALHLLPSSTLSKLKNIGPARVKDMRSLGQSKQILSHIPINANPATCTKFNDALFTAIQLNGDKLAAMAFLPAVGKEAAKELQRCVTKLKFVGGVVALRPVGKGGVSMSSGLEELWSMAEKYHVPIMLRDMWPVGDEVKSLGTAVESNQS
jgi:predicted TIM-barrel fold metal-dependent hydrolase